MPKAIKSEITGVLEVDHYRGVIYFHARDGRAGDVTVLRICGLPRPVPLALGDTMLDITHMTGTNWRGRDE